MKIDRKWRELYDGRRVEEVKENRHDGILNVTVSLDVVFALPFLFHACVFRRTWRRSSRCTEGRSTFSGYVWRRSGTPLVVWYRLGGRCLNAFERGLGRRSLNVDGIVVIRWIVCMFQHVFCDVVCSRKNLHFVDHEEICARAAFAVIPADVPFVRNLYVSINV